MQINQKKPKTNTGRWTKAEHDKFLDALEKYGKDWNKIASKFKNRTLLQIRSHAQKFFLRMSQNDVKAYISPDNDYSSDSEEVTVKQKKIKTQVIVNSRANPTMNKTSQRSTRKDEKMDNDSPTMLNSSQVEEIQQENPSPKFQHVIISEPLNLKQDINDNSLKLQRNSLFVEMLKYHEKYLIGGGNFLSLSLQQ